jgi:hypothetical protein
MRVSRHAPQRRWAEATQGSNGPAHAPAQLRSISPTHHTCSAARLRCTPLGTLCHAQHVRRPLHVAALTLRPISRALGRLVELPRFGVEHEGAAAVAAAHASRAERATDRRGAAARLAVGLHIDIEQRDSAEHELRERVDAASLLELLGRFDRAVELALHLQQSELQAREVPRKPVRVGLGQSELKAREATHTGAGAGAGAGEGGSAE